MVLVLHLLCLDTHTNRLSCQRSQRDPLHHDASQETLSRKSCKFLRVFLYSFKKEKSASASALSYVFCIDAAL